MFALCKNLAMEKIKNLRNSLEKLYEQNKTTLLFHGWHHIYFVAKKSVEFSESIKANTFLVESAGLVHDLNYLAGIDSEPEVGTDLRMKLLKEVGYSEEEINRIEKIILEAHTSIRGKEISPEGMALSDADTLFKSLPITPIMFTSKYIEEKKSNVEKLSQSIVSKQKLLFDQGIYFYTDLAKEKYMKWAEVNLNLWINVTESLKDKDVQELLTIARNNGVL